MMTIRYFDTKKNKTVEAKTQYVHFFDTANFYDDETGRFVCVPIECLKSIEYTF